MDIKEKKTLILYRHILGGSVAALTRSARVMVADYKKEPVSKLDAPFLHEMGGPVVGNLIDRGNEWLSKKYGLPEVPLADRDWVRERLKTLVKRMGARMYHGLDPMNFVTGEKIETDRKLQSAPKTEYQPAPKGRTGIVAAATKGGVEQTPDGEALLRKRIQDIFKTNPDIYAQWIFMRDVAPYQKGVKKDVLWDFAVRFIKPVYESRHGVVDFATLRDIKRALISLLPLAKEDEMEVRPYGEFPAHPLFQRDILIFRLNENEYAVGYLEPPQGHDFYGDTVPTIEEALDIAKGFRAETQRNIVYVTRRNQRRHLT